MNLKRLLILLPAVFLFSGIKTAEASHVPGGNITYECVGPNQFMVTLTLFEDCGTAFTGSGSQSISLNNDCGFPTQTLTLTNTVFQQEVSQLCPSQVGSSECNGGSLPGVYMHQWSALVTLPGPCDSWTFSYTSCCRNTAVNSTAQDSYYWETILNSQTSPCNNSAQITAPPIPYVCINQAVNFNMGAIDPDGNPLVFSLIPALSTNSTTPISYAAGYSGAAPISGASINSATGQISFTPTVLGNFIFAVLVEEFDANGNLVGSVIQDFQFEVINCTNVVPTPPAAGISNFSGGGSVTSSNTLEVCEGDSFCFDLTFTDNDPANVLTVTSNIQQSFPSATVTISGTNPVTATVCATVPSGAPANSIISFEAEDDACPIPGIVSYPISISVISSTYAGTDVIMCDGVGVTLNAGGGSNFNWSVLSGDPMTPANFSCNPCQNPTANPAITTTYIVTSNLSGGCTNTDTVTVNVVPDYTYNITQSATNSCMQDDINIDVTTNPGGPGYTFTWSPTTDMTPTSGPNVVISPNLPGTFTYGLTITSPLGCVHTDSITLTVAAGFSPNATLTATPDTVLCEDTTMLVAVVTGNSVPAMCAASTTGPCFTPTPVTVGTNAGQNDGYTWPAPYGNWYANARHQFLFTAAELNAMGFAGGKISSITWQTTAQNGATATFNGYTIKVGCTGATSLSTSTSWLTGLTTVFGPQNVNVIMGNNTHNFTTAYEWDGVSNLVVEICYSWSAQYNYTYNWSTPYSATGFNSSMYYYSDGTIACNGPAPFGVSTNRPVTTFGTCSSAPNYSYQWLGQPGTNDTLNIVPCTPSNPTSGLVPYTVVVTDANGGCSDTATVYVFVDNNCMPPDTTITNVSCNGFSDGAIVATMVGTTGPWTVNWYDNATNALLQSTPNVTTADSLTGIPEGTYRIETIDTASCSEEVIVVVTEPPALTFTISNDTLICIGGTASLAVNVGGGTPPYTYNWDNGATTSSQTVTPAVNTTYNADVTDAKGCLVSGSVDVIINPPLSVTISSNDTICPGEQATFTASASGGNGGPYSYEWTFNSNVISNDSSVTVTPPGSNSVYVVTVTDNCGTPAATAQAAAFYHAVPQPSFVADNTGDCYPTLVTFTNTTDSSLVGTSLWEFGDGAISNSTFSTTHNFPDPTCYDITLTVTSPDGCVNTVTYNDYICPKPYPNAVYSFGPQPTNIFATEINFINQSSSDAVGYYYDFAGLDSSTDPNPTFTFPDDNPGTYDVTMIVVNQFGCADTVVHTVVIDGVYVLYVPNAFTPNGDGKNDVFYLQGEGFDPEQLEVYIYNRWGELVFYSESIEYGWDGMYRGQEAKGDVYVWKIKSKDIYTNQKFEKFGHITLVR